MTARTLRTPFLACAGVTLLAFAGAGVAQVTISTVAGNGGWTSSGDGGPAVLAGFNGISDVARDGLGNVFVVDSGSYSIRKITPDGVIRRYAGTGQPVLVSGTETDVGDGGPAIAAAISPRAIAADAAGNVFFTDQQHHRVRKISPAGTISTIAGNGMYGFSGDGGPATAAALLDLQGIAVDAAGNVYISAGHAIRRISSSTGTISRIAGSHLASGFSGDGGAATAALLDDPKGLVVDATGNVVVADSGNGRVRRIGPGGVITTVMGAPTAGWAWEFSGTRIDIGTPLDVAVDSKGYIYAISGDSWIRKVSPEGWMANAGGFLCPYASCAPGNYPPPPLGDGGDAFQAYLSGGVSLEIEPGDSVLIGNDHARVRRLTASPPAQPPLARDVFSPYQAHAIDGTPDATAIGDFDGDGRADVVVATRPFSSFETKPDDFKVLLFRQQPDGNLAAPMKNTYTTSTWPLDPGLLMLDLNHDGLKDIVVARQQGLSVYLGNPQGLLVRQDVEVSKLENSSRAMAVATDVNADGHVDVVVAGGHPDDMFARFWVFRGTGAGGFEAPQVLSYPDTFTWWGPWEMTAGDLNGDGREDLIVGGINSALGVYYHDGASGFRSGVKLPLQYGSALAVGDSDDDGRTDLAVFGGAPIPRMMIFRQDAGHRLDAPTQLGLENDPGNARFADMNGDGRSDVLLLHRGWALAYLERSGAGYHRLRKYETPVGNRGFNGGAFAIGMLDADACRDVAVASEFDGLLVYRGRNCQLPAATTDVDADGRGDLAWLAADAKFHLWPGAERAQSVLIAPGAGWGLAAVVDFGGDGRADLLWRNCVNGALARWDGIHAPARPSTLQGPDRAWRLVSSGDFDGNGRADLLWQHASGATERWPDGQPVRRQRGANMPAGWTVVASGDFDGDGRADVFWRHGPTGANLVWRAGGRAGALRVTAITDRDWQVAGAGDVDGDGRADVFWRHRLSGRNAVWPAGQFGARRELQALPDTDWTLAAIEDVDGDRRADAVWHHASGLGLLWKRTDPALAQPASPTPRGFRAFASNVDACSRVPASRPSPAARRGRPAVLEPAH